MNGFLVIDKEGGMTSFDVIRQVRRLCRTRRVGHCGTLDPLATGVLPVAVGEATRLVEFVMEGDKVYRATFKLGEITDTQDAEGTVIESRSWSGVDAAAIERASARFLGTIEQIPPMYSALKRNGVPLYALARKGVEVEREPRRVEILRLELEAITLPYVTCTVTCSKGTYIRTLVHDLGIDLGCGAHLVALRRLRSGAFDEAGAVTLATLAGAGDAVTTFLQPLEIAMAGYPSLELVAPAARQRLQFGIPPQLEEVSGAEELAAGGVVTLRVGGELQAVACYEPDRDRESRGDFRLLRVFPGRGSAADA